MTLLEKINVGIVASMKGKDELVLNTLRSIKTALERFRVDQCKPIDEKVEQSILKTLSKQRREAADAFRSGGREASAIREEAELKIIEGFMLVEATEAEIHAAVEEFFTKNNLNGGTDSLGFVHVKPEMKQMGAIMKIIQAGFAGKTVNGKLLSEKVKAHLV